MTATDLSVGLEEKLKALGLPINPHEIIGRLFRFDCKVYSDSYILIGRIVGLDFRPGTLKLQVSNDTIGLYSLIALYYEGGIWSLCLQEYRTKRFHEGKFQLL